MAVYHASRPRAGVLGTRADAGMAGRVALPPAGLTRRRISLDEDVAALPRRRARQTVRAGRRPNRVGLALGGIAIAFLLAFFSLAQTVRVSATGYDIDQLLVQQEQLVGQRQELLSDLNRLGREPAIRKQAIDLGLSQLVEPLVVPAR
jgi:hypothetical protein